MTTALDWSVDAEVQLFDRFRFDPRHGSLHRKDSHGG
jgi:hypothetical protein